MPTRAKTLVIAGLDRSLTARGYGGAELPLARSETIDWARNRLRAVRRRRGVVGGVGVVVTRAGRAELRPLEVLSAGPGEVTVEVLVSAISAGTERAQWLRLPNAQPAFPFSPGYSGAGRVLVAGAGVAGLAPGTLVAVPRIRHASVATVPAAWVTPVPGSVSVDAAALVYLAIIAGYGVRRAAVRPKDTVCVVGAGPIGALAQRLALLESPAHMTVIAATRRAEESSLRAGAARFATAADGLEDIQASVVIEATGDPAAVSGAVGAARPRGTVVLLGSPRGVTRDAPLPLIQGKRLRLVGAHVSALATEARRAGGDPFRELSETYLEAVADGRLDPGDLVGESLDPREIGLAYRRLAAGELAGGHLDWRLLPSARRVRRRAVARGPVLNLHDETITAPALPGVPVASRPLRVALIGCGDIGMHNARAVSEAANAELVCCYDAVRPLADAVVARFGGSAATSLAAALDADRVDAAFLCVPHDLHASLAVRAAEAGLHVIVEKPLAVDLAGAQEAVDAVAGAGRILSVCLPFRYEPTVQAARALVRAGALGALRGVDLVFHADKPASYWVGGYSGRATSDWRSLRSRAGGGVLIMNVTHYVDFVRYVAGVEVEQISAHAQTAPGEEVEDAIIISFGLSGDASGSFVASARTPGRPPNRFELWGDCGTIRLEPDPAAYSERGVAGITPGRWCPLPMEASRDSRTIFVERLAAAILSGEPPDVTGADGLAVQAFVEAAYRSAANGVPVDVGALVSATA